MGSTYSSTSVTNPITTKLIDLIKTTKNDPNAHTMIKNLVDEHPDALNSFDPLNRTPLMHAVASCGPSGSSTMETVSLLLDLDADPNLMKTTGRHTATALHIAAATAGTTGCHDAVVLLCEQPNINIHKAGYPDGYYANALTCAVHADRPNIDTINYLIRLGVRTIDGHWGHDQMATKIIMMQNAFAKTQ
jgi:hypothetical protein